MLYNENIIALATPAGMGAIAVLRISGPDAITLVNHQFESIHKKNLLDQKSHTIHLGYIKDGDKVLDQVLVSLFKGPNSYTGENVVEISCHGSVYIQQQIIQLFLGKGCRMATEGEFTLRAFLNGKMDLSQAEAVADLIASDSQASHDIAIQQMRGGFSNQIQELREELLNFASLIELELDFSEEDVEFADRSQFIDLLNRITAVLKQLIDSFALGNVLKQGIPVAIVGEPNVGKSTLLNALLNEERAIVSDIPGTTRDTVEDQIAIGGVSFRFIDTAGIRETEDHVEKIGIQRAFEKIEKAQVVLYLFDAQKDKSQEIAVLKEKFPHKRILLLANKAESLSDETKKKLTATYQPLLLLSAKTGAGIEALKEELLAMTVKGELGAGNQIVTNSRHYDSLIKAMEEVTKVKEGMDAELPSDLIAIDIRQVLFHLGEITGQVTNDELLGNIFSNFCIGK
ncbi:tRNA uridine-5-carboxymethylaminomethyl(34) synthesis GTPase MnmE [Croceivirga sp. JEA036]|uniref:tRNA uridine-5-carboxymethylaminomethyl(34) synthesis GTPase MnmE n=1 Tax=Croceivirga sp. JEA036 TaxID=2721162 RepID=UPI00143BB7D3|nr:tRNA uridine-5-carboxymethylaminomethyl(34) synthesis GTPase MnmE [Croceivirga sp. JEA036]NJB35403.1 tRNA uridine-5-carboxymethylaminomethyl(34) synthesis GTPase MnmE [Croceivirga sp. JEA036]